MSKLFSALTVICAYFVPDVLFGFSCLKNGNQSVDWFIIYKTPGLNYYYMDNISKQWNYRGNQLKINDSSSPLMITTYQLVKSPNNQNQMYAIYNDQFSTASSKDSRRAHAKGIVGFSLMEGFWLLHSIPKFPVLTPGMNLFPSSGFINGQMAMCVTFKSNSINPIGGWLYATPFLKPQSKRKEKSIQLYPNAPEISDMKPIEWEHLDQLRDICPFSTNITELKETSLSQISEGTHFKLIVPHFTKIHFPEIFNQTYPSMRDGLMKHQPGINDIYLTELTSKGNTEFILVSKSKERRDDIYEIFSEFLNTTVSARTWRIKQGKCTSNYTPSAVEELKFPQEKTTLISTKDHSKWMISKQMSAVCIGDLNVEKSQNKRGGGLLCLSDSRVWIQFNATITRVLPCRPPASLQSSPDKQEPHCGRPRGPLTPRNGYLAWLERLQEYFHRVLGLAASA